MREAVIVSAVRTPLGSFNGSLSAIGATKLGGIVIEEAVRRRGAGRTEAREHLVAARVDLVRRDTDLDATEVALVQDASRPNFEHDPWP